MATNSVKTVYVPVVLYVPIDKTYSNNESQEQDKPIKSPVGLKINRKRQASTSEPFPASIEQITTTTTTVVETMATCQKTTKTTKKIKKTYYPTAYITNPCEQLFGPPALDMSVTSDKADVSINDTVDVLSIQPNADDVYIPTPRWSKTQTVLLEEFYHKGRFPKSNDIKTIAKRLHVMDSDVEEWFRKRRGRDRKMKRKNDQLKHLMDNYIHH